MTTENLGNLRSIRLILRGIRSVRLVIVVINPDYSCDR
jgi:hypothetical protein